MQEQPRHHGRDAIEEVRPVDSVEQVRHPVHPNVRDRTIWIHFCNSRQINEVASGARKQRKIGLFAPRVCLEILTGCELRRVNEYARDRAARVFLRFFNEREVARMQGPHGGYEADGFTCGFPGTHLLLQGHTRAHDGHRLFCPGIHFDPVPHQADVNGLLTHRPEFPSHDTPHR
jgi:hypothetical protein